MYPFCNPVFESEACNMFIYSPRQFLCELVQLGEIFSCTGDQRIHIKGVVGAPKLQPQNKALSTKNSFTSLISCNKSLAIFPCKIHSMLFSWQFNRHLFQLGFTSELWLCLSVTWTCLNLNQGGCKLPLSHMCGPWLNLYFKKKTLKKTLLLACKQF